MRGQLDVQQANMEAWKAKAMAFREALDVAQALRGGGGGAVVGSPGGVLASRHYVQHASSTTPASPESQSAAGGLGILSVWKEGAPKSLLQGAAGGSPDGDARSGAGQSVAGMLGLQRWGRTC